MCAKTYFRTSTCSCKNLFVVLKRVQRPRSTNNLYMSRDLNKIRRWPVEKDRSDQIPWPIPIHLWKHFWSNISKGIPEVAAGYLREGLQTERGLRGWQRIAMSNFAISTLSIQFYASFPCRVYFSQSSLIYIPVSIRW